MFPEKLVKTIHMHMQQGTTFKVLNRLVIQVFIQPHTSLDAGLGDINRGPIRNFKAGSTRLA